MANSQFAVNGTKSNISVQQKAGNKQQQTVLISDSNKFKETALINKAVELLTRNGNANQVSENEEKQHSPWEVAKKQCNNEKERVLRGPKDSRIKAMLLDVKGQCSSNKCVQNFTLNGKQDGQNVFISPGDSVTCSGNVIMSDLQNLIDPEGHSDGNQIIIGKKDPRSSTGIKDNSQFLGYLAEHMKIDGYRIVAPNIPLQGIFSSDGGYKNFEASGNTIVTTASEERKIAVAGVMNVGNIRGNVDQNGNTIKVYLYPLRLGGGVANIHIMSFNKASQNQGYKYNENIPEVSKNNIKDLRKVPRPGINLYNFDILGFLKAVEAPYYKTFDPGNTTSQNKQRNAINLIKNEALKHGNTH